MMAFKTTTMLNPLWQRRTLATAIDYALVVGYVAVLVVIGMVARALGVRATVDSFAARALAQLLAFLALGLPITLWFARQLVARRATCGKRAAGLGVVAEASGGMPTGFRAVLRPALKILLPWELAHTALWDILAWPGDGGTTLDVALLTASYALVFVYLGTALLGAGRTPYDHIAGTEVVSVQERKETLHKSGNG